MAGIFFHIPEPDPAPAEYLDLTTFTFFEQIADGKVTVTPPKVAFDAMPGMAEKYLYYDFGAGYFGDCVIDFEIKIDNIQTGAFSMVFGLSNTIGDWQNLGSDGIAVYAGSGGNLTFVLEDKSLSNSDPYDDGGSGSDLLYCTFERSGEVATCEFYSDSGRQTLIDTLTIACEAETKRYLYALASLDEDGWTEEISGYAQNFQIISP
jgi:hypothetical protein